MSHPFVNKQLCLAAFCTNCFGKASGYININGGVLRSMVKEGIRWRLLNIVDSRRGFLFFLGCAGVIATTETAAPAIKRIKQAAITIVADALWC